MPAQYAHAVPDTRRNSERAFIAIAVRKRVANRIFLCQASNISVDGIFLDTLKAYYKSGSQRYMKKWRDEQ